MTKNIYSFDCPYQYLHIKNKKATERKKLDNKCERKLKVIEKHTFHQEKRFVSNAFARNTSHCTVQSMYISQGHKNTAAVKISSEILRLILRVREPFKAC